MRADEQSTPPSDPCSVRAAPPLSALDPSALRVRRPLFPQFPFDLVVVAASVGGVSALRTLLASLPADFPTPVAITQHIVPTRSSSLNEIWSDRGRMSVHFARAGDRLRRGKVFIAPPDRHLILRPDCRWAIEDSSRVNYVRPAADLLFESAARILGRRVLGVVLTGTGCDGARGAHAIKERGGTLVVQDPADAEAPAMPQATIDRCKVDLVMPLASVAHCLIALTENAGVRELLGLAHARPEP
jgi:two-component system, chemotaxis family, protein-glutamate methylesterase/glutaminase